MQPQPKSRVFYHTTHVVLGSLLSRSSVLDETQPQLQGCCCSTVCWVRLYMYSHLSRFTSVLLQKLEQKKKAIQPFVLPCAPTLLCSSTELLFRPDLFKESPEWLGSCRLGILNWVLLQGGQGNSWLTPAPLSFNPEKERTFHIYKSYKSVLGVPEV